MGSWGRRMGRSRGGYLWIRGGLLRARQKQECLYNIDMNEDEADVGQAPDLDATVVELSEMARGAIAKDSRKATRGYINGPAVALTLRVSSLLDEALKNLAAENEGANEFAVFLAVTKMLAETGLDQDDHTLVVLGTILSPFELGEHPLLSVAAQYKSREGERGLFAQLLRDNLSLAGPALFELFQRLKAARLAAPSVEVAQPKAETAVRVAEVTAGGHEGAVDAGNRGNGSISGWFRSRVSRLLSHAS